MSDGRGLLLWCDDRVTAALAALRDRDYRYDRLPPWARAVFRRANIRVGPEPPAPRRARN